MEKTDLRAFMEERAQYHDALALRWRGLMVRLLGDSPVELTKKLDHPVTKTPP